MKEARQDYDKKNKENENKEYLKDFTEEDITRIKEFIKF